MRIKVGGDQVLRGGKVGRIVFRAPSVGLTRRGVTGLATLSLLVAAQLGLMGPAHAQSPGDLDPTFGNGGVVVTTAQGSQLASAAAQGPNGYTVVAGAAANKPNNAGQTGLRSFVVARYNPGGQLDSSFGGTGVVTTSFGLVDDEALGVALQPDGKVVAVGTTSSTTGGAGHVVAIARLGASGGLDPTFGAGGVTTTAIRAIAGENDQARAVAIQGDGKIVVAGTSFTGTTSQSFVARYTTGGALDPTFGTGGIVTSAIPVANTTLANQLTGLAVYPSGGATSDDIVLSGTGCTNNCGLAVEVDQAAVVRLQPNGTPDAGFGTGGLSFAPAGASYGAALAIQPDGSVVTAGRQSYGVVGQNQFMVARFTPSGMIDTTFGSGGLVLAPFDPNDDEARSVTILPAIGKIAVAGFSQPGGRSLTAPYAVAVAQYNGDGSPDATFGSGGRSVQAVGSGDAKGFALVGQSDTNLVVAGAFRPLPSQGIGLLRILGEPLAIDNVALVQPVTAPAIASFTVRLAVPSGVPVTVDYTTNAHTAQAGTDFIPQSGTVTFLPGQISQQINITVVNGSYAGPDVFFTVDLFGAVHAAIVTPQGVGSIHHVGYSLVGSDGGMFIFGNNGFHGSMGGQHLNSPIVAMAATPSHQGYWLVGRDGGIFGFGDAGFHGSMGGHHLNSPIVGMAATPDGQGYWLVGADGGIFGFGDAGFHGSMGGQHLNSPIVGIAAAPNGQGYWMVGADGGIFGFGAVGYFGSMGGQHLNAPIVAITPSPNGLGYWLVGTDGGTFGFGAVGYFGSMGGQHLNAPVVAMAASPTGGYWLVATDGGLFRFGDAAFFGSMGGSHLNAPIVAMTAG